jgi:hypothetical protein
MNDAGLNHLAYLTQIYKPVPIQAFVRVGTNPTELCTAHAWEPSGATLGSSLSRDSLHSTQESAVEIVLDDAGTSYVAIYFRPACSIFPNSYNGKNDG